MKTAILKIEVPDDFEKGDCNKCPLDIPNVMTVDCYAENCPLEIEDNSCETCKHYDVMFIDYPCDECSCGIADNYEPRGADKEIDQC